jgi:hypothetical protein
MDGSGQPDVVMSWFDDEVYRNTPIDDRVVEVTATEVLPDRGTEVKDGKRVERDESDIEKEVSAARESWKKDHAGSSSGPFPFRSEVLVRRYEGMVPQKVVVTFEGGTVETFPFPEGERWHRYLFVRPEKVISAELDPDRSVLLDLDKLDDSRTRETQSTASTRWALELSNAVELFLSLLVTG